MIGLANFGCRKPKRCWQIHRAKRFFNAPRITTSGCSGAFLSVEGLAIANAVGEMLAYRHYQAPSIFEKGLPASPWFRTDDSEMAISIVEGLNPYGYVHQDALARCLAWRYEREPDRGYGSMTRAQLIGINRSGDWR